MQFIDEAIVLSSGKFGENSGIACVLTSQHGIYKGLVRGISSKQNRGIYQLGNVVEITWRARLSEHLGSLSAGLLYSGAGCIMGNPERLAALSSLCAIFATTLQERDPVIPLYKSLRTFLGMLAEADENWQKSYVLLELELLSQLGYGIDLSECAATGTRDNLIYVSPKSGRAVCAESGAPYHDKMLKLPQFVSEESSSHTTLEINDGLALSGYFLDKYFFAPHNIPQPQARRRFVSMYKPTTMVKSPL
jgi:DNA repair protein RecO (recombination protein O)